MNAALLRSRATVVRALRDGLFEEGFLEVQPPVRVSGPALEENLEAVPSGDAWLHTSPEFALKRVLAAGLPRVYAITPCFRAEERGAHHELEFTMLELYFCNANYLDLVPVVEALIGRCASAVAASPPSFDQTTVALLYAGAVPEDDDRFFRSWVEEIDPVITARTAGPPPSGLWVRDYPARHAALAEVRGPVSERLELYFGGIELANGFSELRDGAELRSRFEASAAHRRAAGRAPHPTDEGVIAASDRFPRAAGIALGVDRLVMALTGARHIQDVSVPA